MDLAAERELERYKRKVARRAQDIRDSADRWLEKLAQIRAFWRSACQTRQRRHNLMAAILRAEKNAIIVPYKPAYRVAYTGAADTKATDE